MIKNRLAGIISGALLALPVLVNAQDGTGAFSADTSTLRTSLENIVLFANNVLIPFILAIGFLAFVWGMFQYFIAGGANEEKKEAGKSLMIYATLGFVLVIIFWGVVNLLSSSTGFNDQTLTNPKGVTIPAATP